MGTIIYDMSAAGAMLVVLVVMKWLFEDFGILMLTGKTPRALHIMKLFPNEKHIMLIHRMLVEICAASCGCFVFAYAIDPGGLLIPAIVISAVATVSMYISYRNTRLFFLTVEEEIIRYLKDAVKGDDVDEEDS